MRQSCFLLVAFDHHHLRFPLGLMSIQAVAPSSSISQHTRSLEDTASPTLFATIPGALVDSRSRSIGLASLVDFAASPAHLDRTCVEYEIREGVH
ncbi:hypothetical protein BDV98DRAFT_572970 [Pterulicium gracile]|uniref:Uncharacterized protein n=1 Tax=Pterulicium gracile TaxID=1884261 RepID=A0A5C3Q898_9AGAR|nr:hypothetical protein BDV98DRAFT_572970 [Pterula gracilis]